MTFNFNDLSTDLRTIMNGELTEDIRSNRLYKSERLTKNGAAKWEELLSEAIIDHDEDWLRDELINRNLIDPSAPANAAELLAHTEFNRFYMRAVCIIACKSGGSATVEVYRAKQSAVPRPSSIKAIGQKYNAASMLTDLRANKGETVYFGEPGSGLTLKIG